MIKWRPVSTVSEPPKMLASMVPLLIKVKSLSPIVPLPEIVLLTFVSVRGLPSSVIRLLPLEDRETLPPPESITFEVDHQCRAGAAGFAQ